MSEVPQLSNLANVARLEYPNVPIEMAIVANTNSTVLKDSLAQSRSYEGLLDTFESIGNRVYETISARSSELSPEICLPETARAVMHAQDLRAEHSGEVQLEQDIELLKRKLSKPMRMAAILLCSLGLAGPAEYKTYEQVHPSHGAGQSADIQPRLSDSEQANLYVFAGAFSGLLGAVGGIIIGEMFNDIEAKRRAGKIAGRQRALPVTNAQGA